MIKFVTGLEGVAPVQASWTAKVFRMTFQPIGRYHKVRPLDEEDDWNSGTVWVRHRVTGEMGTLSWKGQEHRVYTHWRPATLSKRTRRKFNIGGLT